MFFCMLVTLVNNARIQKVFSCAVQLQTRVGPSSVTRVGQTNFYHFKTHTMENQGGGGVSGPPVPRSGSTHEFNMSMQYCKVQKFLDG